MHLRCVAQYRRPSRIQLRPQRDADLQLGGELVERLPYHLLDMDRHPLAHSAATEDEHAVDNRAAALAGDQDALEVTMEAAVIDHVAHGHLTKAEDRAQDVVEVVRDTARERPHGLK